MSDLVEGLRDIAGALKKGCRPPGAPFLMEDAATEIARLRDLLNKTSARNRTLARAKRHRGAAMKQANERLGEAMALLGDWQATPVRDHGHGDVAARTRSFMESDAIELMSLIGAAEAVKETDNG